jgi:hypothetical protein
VRRFFLISLCLVSCSSAGCLLEKVGSGEDFALGDDSGSDTLISGDDSSVDSALDDSTIDSSIDDSSTTDSSAVDSAIDDSAIDSGPFDTGAPDTGPFDTGTPDTGPFDTGPFDTGAPDTGPEVIVTGSLTGKGEAGPSPGSTTNLTTEGTLGWAHWGLFMGGDFNHRSAADLISKGSVFGGSASRYNSYPVKFSWSDGTPTATATTSAGLYLTGNGDGFTFDAAGDPAAVRTLRVYVAWNNATGTIEATLSDGSAPAWSGPIPPAPKSSTFIEPAVYTLTFKPATAGAKLNIKLTKTNGGMTYLSLLAASLK